MNRGCLVLGAFLALGVVACSGADSAVDEDETSSADALRARVMEGSFKLYSTPTATPNPACDPFTSLELVNTGSGASARLRDELSGACEIFVLPNARSFRLRQSPGSCGTKVYEGSRRVAGKRSAIKISDHREATCGLHASAVVVEETLADGSVVTRYSANQPAPGPGTPAVWLTFAPRQCNSNAWNGAIPTWAPASSLQGEAGDVDSFFRAQGITLDEVGFLKSPTIGAVCAACQCPRGDLLAVRVNSVDDAKTLENDYGFTAASSTTVGAAKKSCNTNPWDTGSGPGSLPEWAASQGDVSYAGTTSPTTPVISCMACGCPTGDRAVVVAEDTTTTDKLATFGFSPLE